MSNRNSNKLTHQLAQRSRKRREALATETRLAEASSRGRNDLLSEMKLENRRVSSLHPPAHNVRKTDKNHITEIAISISELGFSRPILITSEGEIIDGVIQWEAAASLNLEEIPCVVVSGHSPEQIRMLRVALNRLGEQGEWDLGALKLELEEIELAEGPIEILGFSDQEIDQILQGQPLDPRLDAVPEVDPNKPAVARVGDVWQLGRHRVACADATQPESYGLLFQSDDALARAMFTDPPYNIRIDGFAVGKGEARHEEFIMASGEMTDDQFTNFLRSFLEASAPHLMDGAAQFICMDWRHSEHLQVAIRQAELNLVNLIVWSKGQGGMGGLYRSAHELVFLARKARQPMLNNVQLGKHGRDRSNVWTYPGANRRGSSAGKALADHPTPKPVELVADALLDVTHRDELVVDPFLGSGTTIIAAESCGRIAFGLELDPKYVDVIIKRFEVATGIKAMELNSAMTYSELAQARDGHEDEER